jgi:flagellin-like protein
MKMRRLVKNKRGISPIIATLLLIAIAVAAAVVTYSWVMSMIAVQSAQSQTSIKIDFVQFTGTTNSSQVYVTVRNAGGIPATIDKIYITRLNDTHTDTLAYSDSVSGGTFSIGSAGAQTVSVASTTKYTCTLKSGGSIGSFTIGQPYKIELITTTGFSTEGTYYR